MNNYNISLLPGDGTGPEVINETVKILEKTETKYDVKFNFTNNDLGLSLIHISEPTRPR